MRPATEPPVVGRPYTKIERRRTLMTTDVLAIKLERVNALADILYSLLVDYPQAQILAEIIMETSSLQPED